MDLPQIIQDAIFHISKLPGVGTKTAQRYALNLARWNHDELKSFSNAILKICDLSNCEKCGMFADDQYCHICNSPRSTTGIICVVENITDFIAIEKSGTFHGVYHILGGVLNPLMGIGPDDLRIHGLIDRIKVENISEVILAVNPSVEGDATCSYINQMLPENVTVERIGFGMPMGGSFEYLDPMTIGKALENKKRM